jgi:hypothetical protein
MNGTGAVLVYGYWPVASSRMVRPMDQMSDANEYGRFSNRSGDMYVKVPTFVLHCDLNLHTFPAHRYPLNNTLMVLCMPNSALMPKHTPVLLTVPTGGLQGDPIV